MGQISSRRKNTYLDDVHQWGSPGDNLDVDATLKFSFLQDEETVLYLKCSQMMIVLRGLPGSGKSYLAQRLKEKFGTNCEVCSIDDYFSQGSHYRFDPTKLEDATTYCRELALEACKSGKHVVVVDDENLNLNDVSYFARLAHKSNYVLLVEEPRTVWKFNIVTLASKNRRNLGEIELNEILECWEEILPIYFGWFLNVNDSLALVNIAEAYLDECIGIPEFSEQFKDVMSYDGYNDIHEYFNLPTHDMLHCTTHFCHDGTKKDDYMKQELVQNSYGSKTSLCVVGFVITPHTFLARVKLSSHQLNVWGQDDYESPPPIQEAVDVARSGNSNERTDRRTESRHFREPVCITTLRPYANPEKKTSQCFQPTEGLGRRAHITLGCAKGVAPVQAGFDLIETVEMEKASSKTTVPTFDITCAKVRKYGEATWAIYPNKLYVIDAIFAFYMSALK